MKKKAYLYGLVPTLIFCSLLSSCTKKADPIDFLSEDRKQVYIAECEGMELKIYAGEREVPYSSDGIKGGLSDLLEVFLTMPEQSEPVLLELSLGGKNCGGEMNYDKVKGCYSFSESIPCEEKQLSARVKVGETEHSFQAEGKRTSEHLTSAQAVTILQEKESELFSTLSQGKEFLGEIAVRFLYDEGCYFYVAVTERSGKITALLLEAKSGEVLARKVLNG